MPYSMMVLVPPIPDDDAEAIDWIFELDESLAARPQPLDQRLKDLVAALVRIYPEPSDLPDERAEECVWAESPLVGNGHGGLLHFALSGRHDIDPLIAYIVEAANSRGLIAFDGETLHRP